MGDVNNLIFRTKSEPSEERTARSTKVEKIDAAQTIKADGDVPFTDYQKEHNHPFLVDHFELGDSWQDKYGGFEEEIDTIEGYFRGKIEHGQMQNDTEAVKEQFKKIYKLCNIDKTERVTMQIEKLAAYIKFLKETDDIKMNHYKYGN
jgi:hypothetical protein